MPHHDTMTKLLNERDDVIRRLKAIRRLNRITTALSWVTIALVLAALIISLCPCACHGELLDLTATSQAPQEWTDFTLQFQDVLTTEQIVNFSGVRYLPFGDFYDVVLQAPGISWIFGGYLGQVEVSAETWTYTQTPIAPSLIMFLSGLAGLCLLGWRRIRC